MQEVVIVLPVER